MPWRLFGAFAAALYVLALPVFLVTSNVRFLAGEVRFYERGFREYGAVEATGLPLPELDRAAEEIVDYFEDDADTLRIVVGSSTSARPTTCATSKP
jgi:hypothetical protein